MNDPNPKIVMDTKPDVNGEQHVIIPPRYGVGSWITITILILLTACTVLIASQLPNDPTRLSEQPVVARLCEHVDCSFLTAENAWVDTEHLEITDVSLYEDKQNNRFTLHLSMTNTGEHTQTLPDLTVRLLDSKERPIEQRGIKLKQYAQQREISTGETRRFELQLNGIPEVATRYTVAIDDKN